MPWSLANVPARADESVPPLLASLRIGPVDDPLEREADRVADQVTGPAAGAASVPPAGEAALRRAAEAGAGGAGPAPDAAVADLGPGVPLGAGERSFFEPRLGRDLSAIRIHIGGAAHKASSAIAARAFTLGTDIAFAEGEYRPSTAEGRHLLAHELAHTLQADAGNGAIRRKCADAPPECTEEKLTKAQEKAAAHPEYASYVFRAATAACYRPTDIAASIKETDSHIYEGLLAQYISQAFDPVNNIDAAKIHPGDCFAFPRGWKDPNIGDVDQQLGNLRASTNVAEKNRIIATLYAEQSAGGMDEQRKYIFYAMLLRIKDPNWGPTFAAVVTPGTFHGSDPSSDTYKTNYQPAIAYLEQGVTQGVNTAVIDSLKAIVDGASLASIPTDAGPYYFHWSSKTTTAETEYQAQIAAKKSADVAEKKGAYKQAKNVLGAPMTGITETMGWLKKIPGPAGGRFGSMYIYR